MLDVTSHEKYLGRAEVARHIQSPKYGFIAGCTSWMVSSSGMPSSLARDNVVIHEGKIGFIAAVQR